MSTDRWQKIKGIFDDALKLAPARRPAFLQESCGSDLDLRAEVESLLASFIDAESFMDQPAVGQVASLIAASHETLAAGQHLGQYEIVRAIGAGGMGEIYLAYDSRLDRQVALKLLPAQFTADADRARRFKQEARAASALNHPNIITIHEIGETETHQLFIVTEYIEGQTLRPYLERGSLPMREWLEIAIQITGALAAAHAAGIVHRDIKPENVMLRPDGIVKVLDFGLAKLTEAPAPGPDSQGATVTYRGTEPGLVMGTVNYMSPEQARGLEVDGRTDIFSCGVLFYEMLAGRTPFAAGTTADTLAAILNQEPTSLARWVPEVPGELQRIVGKMLRKDRDERYQTAKDLLLDLKDLRDELHVRSKLDRARASEPAGTGAAQALQIEPALTTPQTVSGNGEVEARTGPGPAAETNWLRRRLVLLLTLAAIGFAGIAITAGIWVLRERKHSLAAIRQRKILQVTSWPGLDDYPSIAPDGRTVAYCSNHTGGFEIFVKALAAGAQEVQLTADGKQNLEPAWSPDGQYIAFYSKLRGGIWVIPATGGAARQLTDFGSAPAWSPDGTRIAFQSNPVTDLGAGGRNALAPSTIWLVSAQGGDPKQLTKTGTPVDGHGAPAWSPDGKRIAFEADEYSAASVWSISVDGDRLQQIASLGSAPAFAPDGKSIFYVNGTTLEQIAIDSDSGKPVGDQAVIQGIGGLPALIRRIGFSGDGRHLVYSVISRTESITSLPIVTTTLSSSGAPVTLAHNTSTRMHTPDFSPDGKRIAFTTCQSSGTGCDIWLMNSDGSNQTQVTTDPANELGPSWSPDMGQLAYMSTRSGHRALWAIDLNTKRERLLLDVPGEFNYARLSRDGRQVAFNLVRDGVINTWIADLAGGAPRQLTFDKELTGFPAWSPDGKFVSVEMQRGDDSQVAIVPVAGGDPIQLTLDKGQSWSGDWSPDGDKVLFAGNRNGIWNIWWVSRTTKKEQQLTNYTKLNSFVRYPAWSPLGDQVVYEYSETTGNVWVAEVENN